MTISNSCGCSASHHSHGPTQARPTLPVMLSTCSGSDLTKMSDKKGYLVDEGRCRRLMGTGPQIAGASTACCQHYLVPTLLDTNTTRCQHYLISTQLSADTAQCQHYSVPILAGRRSRYRWLVGHKAAEHWHVHTTKVPSTAGYEHCSLPTILSANTSHCQHCSVPTLLGANTTQCQHTGCARYGA